MLKHENDPGTTSQPAAQVRVTPEELAAAITRLEARKDAGQRHTAGTIPIGEAVQQLGVDTTPEEVLAEVWAIRQEPMRTKRRPSVAGRLVLALGLSGVLLGLALDVNGLQQTQDHQTVVSANISSVPVPISLNPNLLVGDAAGKLVMLSEVGDNQPVRCTFDNQGSLLRQYYSSNAQALWTLIKHNGKVYVRGQILKMSPKVFLSEGVDVTTVGDDPAFAIPITLPVKGFNVVPGAGSYVEFHALNIHLDKHAYEKWQP